jgi:Flp pilus assembly protein CpaB
MGKWRAVIPIVLALMIAVVASYAIYKYVKKQVAPKEVAKMEEVKVRQAAIAMVELPAGTQLKPKMIKTVPFLEESLPPACWESCYFSDKKQGTDPGIETGSCGCHPGRGVGNFKARETRYIYKGDESSRFVRSC